MLSVPNLLYFAGVVAYSFARPHEPACSQFDFQERLLEKSVRFEHKLEVYDEMLKTWEAKIQKTITELDASEVARNEEVKTVRTLYQQSVRDTKQKLEQTMENIQQKSEKTDKQLEDKEKEINLSLEDSLRKYDSELKAFTEAYRTPTVMFTANTITDKDNDYGKVIKFTTLVSNIGNGYDTNTGEFTAPYSGSYLFHTSVCPNVNKWICIHLVARDTVIGSTCLYHASQSGSCSSTSGLTTLKEGDKVCVEGSHAQTGVIFSGDRHRRPTFSGMLIHVEI